MSNQLAKVSDATQATGVSSSLNPNKCITLSEMEDLVSQMPYSLNDLYEVFSEKTGNLTGKLIVYNLTGKSITILGDGSQLGIVNDKSQSTITIKSITGVRLSVSYYNYCICFRTLGYEFSLSMTKELPLVSNDRSFALILF